MADSAGPKRRAAQAAEKKRRTDIITNANCAKRQKVFMPKVARDLPQPYLSHELWVMILEQLQPSRLLVLGKVSHSFHELVRDAPIWSQLAQRLQDKATPDNDAYDLVYARRLDLCDRCLKFSSESLVFYRALPVSQRSGEKDRLCLQCRIQHYEQYPEQPHQNPIKQAITISIGGSVAYKLMTKFNKKDLKKMIKKKRKYMKTRVLGEIVRNDRLTAATFSKSTRFRNGVDFVTALPHELLGSVLDTFPTKELASLAFVSVTWYSRITQSASLWRDLDLSKDSEATWLMLGSIREHVWNLKYDSDTGNGTDDDNLGDRLYDLYRRTSKVSDSRYLKYLTNENFPLNEMLSLFVNIKQLKYIGSEPGNHLNSLLSSTTMGYHHRIAKMELSLIPGLSPEHIEAILKSCPSLRFLAVSLSSWHVADAIKCYPNLEVFFINPQHNETVRSLLSTTVSSSAYIANGLRVLSLEAETEDVFERLIFTSFDISDLVTSNSETLHELRIMCNNKLRQPLHSILSRTINWHRIYSTTFKYLCRLHCIIPTGLEAEFSQFIRQCTQITDCRISHLTFITANVLDSLALNDKRMSLEFNYGTGLDMDAFKRLLKNSEDRHNVLQHLCFNECSISREILDVISMNDGSLRGIELYHSVLAWEHLQDFVTHLNHSPTIEWVILNNVRCMENERTIGTDHLKPLLDQNSYISVPDRLSTDLTTIILDIQKHANVARDILLACDIGRGAGESVYPFIHKQLNNYRS